MRTPLAALASLTLLAALTACSTPAASGGSTGAAPAASVSATVSAAAGGASTDVCALVPAAELVAAVGVDVGTGVDADENGLSDCTWKPTDTHTVLAQYTEQADMYLPDSVWPKPDGAADLTGVDRGWASADSNEVLVVKGGRGILLTNIDFGDPTGGQDAWTALGQAIAGKL